MRLCDYTILTPAGIATTVAAKSVTTAIYMAAKLVATGQVSL